MLREAMEEIIEAEAKQAVRDLAVAFENAHTEENPEPLAQEAFLLHRTR
jgi:hypothetical protein